MMSSKHYKNVIPILEPRRRRIIMVVTIGIIVAIAIVGATTGTIIPITPNKLSVIGLNKTNSTQTILLHTQTQDEIDCKERINNTTKENILTYFKNISTHKTMTGLSVFIKKENRYKGLEIIKSTSGTTPAVLSITMPEFNAEEHKWKKYMQKIISNWKEGYFVKLWWDLHQNPLGSMKLLHKGNETEWNDLIKDGGELNNVWKNELDILAVYLKQLQMEGVIIILDIMPFMNQKYALWSGRRGLNGSLKLYQLTHDYLTKHHGLHSLIWAWSLSKKGGLTELQDYWPGDQYIDVVAIYMWNYNELSSIEYQHLLDVVRNKPIAMEGLKSIPTIELLSRQPQWTWFTIFEGRRRFLGSFLSENATIC